MILDYVERKTGWWIEVQSTVPCGVSKDGLIVKFYLKDVKEVMDKQYPFSSKWKVWYFNSTKDREIAEIVDEFVYANPQVLWTHFMKQED